MAWLTSAPRCQTAPLCAFKGRLRAPVPGLRVTQPGVFGVSQGGGTLCAGVSQCIVMCVQWACRSLVLRPVCLKSPSLDSSWAIAPLPQTGRNFSTLWGLSELSCAATPDLSPALILPGAW